MYYTYIVYVLFYLFDGSATVKIDLVAVVAHAVAFTRFGVQACLAYAGLDELVNHSVGAVCAQTGVDGVGAGECIGPADHVVRSVGVCVDFSSYGLEDVSVNTVQA